MPPRTRKSAEPATPPAADTSTAPEAPTVAPEEETAPPVQGADAPGETAPQPEASGPDEPPQTAEGAAVAALLAPPAITYHWESVTGDGSAPCRACPPGGPPPGTGSYGCPHGQWVRVQDAD